jgi:phosphatidylglycerophosphatase A
MFNKKNISYIVSTFFGAGYFPKASGTFTSLITIPFSILICYFFGFEGIFFISCILCFLGFFCIKEVLRYTAHDPSFIVIDEVVGQMITFVLCAKYLKHNLSMISALLYFFGFILFRFFDIFKFGLVKWADEKLNNHFGVMLDDVFAGIFSSIILYIVMIFFI